MFEGILFEEYDGAASTGPREPFGEIGLAQPDQLAQTVEETARPEIGRRRAIVRLGAEGAFLLFDALGLRLEIFVRLRLHGEGLEEGRIRQPVNRGVEAL